MSSSVGGRGFTRGVGNTGSRSRRRDRAHMSRLGAVHPSSPRYVPPPPSHPHNQQVSPESLLVFPTLGIQLETHRGHPLLPTLSTTHHFIPLSALEDIVIHEGFRRWDVRYYLAALKRTRGSGAYESSERAASGSGVEIRVAFEVRSTYISPFAQSWLTLTPRRTSSPTFRSSKKSISASN